METKKVVTIRWFLLSACVAWCAVYVCAEPEAPQKDRNSDDVSALLGSILGFKPCMDEGCRSYGSSTPDSVQPGSDADYEAQEYDPQELEPDASNTNENPQIHCIILRPSSVKTFSDIEGKYLGLSDIKYKVLEDLISHMYEFSDLKLENCDPRMKLVDLVILAANSLKTQYVLQGESNCTYMTSTSRIGLSTPTPLESYPTKGHEKPKTSHSVEQNAEYPHVGISQKPCSESVPDHPYQEVTEAPEKPCTGEVDYQPDEESSYEEIDGSFEISDAQEHLSPPFVGSVRGIPGIHYPNYSEIPITSFTCEDKYIPGFYADLETGCQVFHVCYEHRRESFLCPVGTIFNQPILACDYWYSSNCSLASAYYKVNEKKDLEEAIDHEVQEIVSVITLNDTKHVESYEPDEDDLDTIAQFLPIKAKVVSIKPVKEMQPEPVPEVADVDEVASDIFDNIMVTATKVTSKTRDVVRSIPEPSIKIVQPVEPQFPKVAKTEPVKLEDFLAQSIIPVAKAKLAAATLPVSKVKASIPVIAKTKLAVPAMKVAAAKAAVPIVAKAKLAAAVPVVAAKAVPVAAKVKMAAAVPVAKVAAAKAAVPFAKVAAAKVAVKTAVPIAKVAAAKVAVPVAKVAAAKIAVKTAVPVAKVAAAKVAIPVAKVAAAKVAVKTAVPFAKVAAAKVAVPVAKVAAAKVAVKTAVPVAKVAAAKVVPVAKAAAVKVAAPVIAKAKVAATIPVAKAAAMKVALPAVAKSKAAIPVVKGKLAAKAFVPAIKTKMLASAVPLAKAKLFSPVLKGKIIAGGKAPLLKAKMMALPLAKAKLAGSVPLAKVKLAKAAAISPLTKKALAVGYMKLLKAKKLAVMG